MFRHVHLLTLFTTLLCLTGCGVDEFRNLQRIRNCEECQGTCIAGQFCVPNPDGGLPGDAGGGDASIRDAGYGGDEDGGDDEDAGAFVAEACSEEGKVELCYDGKEPSTAAQLPCRPGTRTCRNKVFGKCEGDVVPKQERCNNEDDDCDGNFDEDLSSASDCTIDTLKGECAVGVELCRDGMLKCLQENFPQSDTCDGKDNDCDDKTDEQTEVACYDGAADGCDKDSSGEYACTGSCQAGTHACTNGEYDESSCQGQVSPANADACTEPGDASGDEDCDGQVDEGCTCLGGTTCYTGPTSTQTREPCHAGTKECVDATHGTCENEVTPTAEHCGNEGLDNDCDGTQDDIPFRGTSCAEVSEGIGACKAGATWQCVDDELQCVDAQAGSSERCDAQNVDENCNGATNEGFNLLTDRNNCGACGVVCMTGLQCCGGSCVNVTSNNSHCSRCGMVCGGATACCSNACVNVQTDPSNCGTCGHVCSGLLKGCTNGVCTKLLL